MNDRDPARPPGTASDLGRFLRPASIAVVGASTKPGSLSNQLLVRLTRSSFGGTVRAVNPGAAEIAGVPAVASLAEFPGVPDVVAMMRSTPAALEELDRARDLEVPFVILFNSLAEQFDQFNAVVREHLAGSATRVLGPNTLGFMNYADDIALTFTAPPLPRREPHSAAVRARRRGVAVMGHSGGVSQAIAAEVGALGGHVTQSISLGNEADLKAVDFLEWFVEDPTVGVVAAYLEQVREPVRFLAATRALRAAGKHLVLLRVGASGTARTLAMSHTGALVGSFEHEGLFLRDAGAVLVDSSRQAGAVAAALAVRGPSAATGLSVVTQSGGLSGIMADAAERHGVDLPPLRPADHRRLHDLLAATDLIDPDLVNPIDLGAPGFDDEFALDVVATVLDDPAVGAVLLLTSENMVPRSERAAELAAAVDKPLGLLQFKKDLTPFAHLIGDGVPTFSDEDEAVAVLGAMLNAGPAVPAPAPDQVADAAPVAPPTSTTEDGVKRWLRDFGVPSPGSVVVGLDADLAAAVTELHFPVVLKASSAGLAHKSEVGGVVVGLPDADAVAGAAKRMADAFTAAGLPLEGFLVEEQVSTALPEWFVGVVHDGVYGPAISVGLGGVAIEALAHLRAAVCPLDPAAARRLVTSLPAWATLTRRGLIDATATAAMAELVSRVSVVADRSRDWLHELDLNPVFVTKDGRVMALDAAITVRPGTDAARPVTTEESA